MLFTEASSEIIDGIEDLGLLPNGAHLYRKSNGVGGHTYCTDECGIMTTFWDTCVVNRSTVIAALLYEEHHRYRGQMSKKRKTIDRNMEIERAAATGESFLCPIPKKGVK